MADGDYPPHPLVAALAKGLTRTDGKLSRERDALEQAESALRQAKQSGEPIAEVQDQIDVAASALADAIATDAALPQLHTFAGFLGGTLDDSGGRTGAYWRLLYLDPKLRTWLLVDQKSILARAQVDDETSPFGTRDHVWMKSDASVSEGEGAVQKDEIQARFMRGAFVSAGQFAAAVTQPPYS